MSNVSNKGKMKKIQLITNENAKADMEVANEYIQRIITPIRLKKEI